MLKTYIKLSEPIKAYTELEIGVDYEKESFNLFNGQKNKQGIYVYLKPVKREKGVISCTLLGNSIKEKGFKVFITPLSRKSQKKIEKVFNSISDEKIELIEKYYSSGEFWKIIELLA